MEKVTISSWRAGRARGVSVWTEGQEHIKTITVGDTIEHRGKKVGVLDRGQARKILQEWATDHGYSVVEG